MDYTTQLYRRPLPQYPQLQRIPQNSPFHQLLNSPPSDQFQRSGSMVQAPSESHASKKMSLGKMLKYAAGAFGVYHVLKFARRKLLGA